MTATAGHHVTISAKWPTHGVRLLFDSVSDFQPLYRIVDCRKMARTGALTLIGGSLLVLIVAGMIAQKNLPPPKPKIVGIDLGTTYSCIGVFHAVTGEIEVFRDEQGHQTFPSVVAVTEDTVLFGHEAMAQLKTNPEFTYYDAKRFIGKKFCALEPEDTEGRYQFNVENADGRPVFALPPTNPLHTRFMTPEKVGSEVMQRLVDLARNKLRTDITKVVVSVPAKFSESQRNATQKAAELAGLEVVRIIQEPTAAAMAYGLHKRSDPSMVLVVDLGGGTLDVSLLRVHGGMFMTLSTAGNNRLGGQDFNERLLAHVQRAALEKYGCSVSDPHYLQQMHLAVEKAKLTLTTEDWALIHVFVPACDSGPTAEPEEMTLNVTRMLFEKLNDDLFQNVLEPIKAVLTDVEATVEEVNEIVLVGGSTRIPKIRQIVSEYFGGKKLNLEVDPDLAVVHGAATQAGIISGMWPLKVSAVEIPYDKSNVENC